MMHARAAQTAESEIMQQRSVTHSTFVIERNYPVAPERVFAAFSDVAKKRRWFAEGEGFDVEEFQMDFRVGGSEQIRFRSKDARTFVNHTIYQDILPNRHIVLAYTMSVGDKRISSSQVTVEFLQAQKGTDLIFTEQGAFFEGADGPQMRQQGWGQLLEQLARELAR
jgi:uncharacterized protein YndB with AHSA1/START domain